MRLGALGRTAHQQFAIEHRACRKGRRDIGKAAADIVAGARVKPRIATGMDQLNPDSIPFPFGGIIVEVDPGLVEWMGEHERPEHRNVLGGGLRGTALAPIEQLQIWRLQPVPHLLDRLDIDFERIGQRLLGQARRNPDPKCAGGKLEQGIAPRHVEMVEHGGQHRRRVALRHRLEPLHCFRQADGAIVQHRLPLRHRPQQRHRLRHVANIVAAHPEQDRVDPFLGQRPHDRRLDRGYVERTGQCRQRQPAIWVRRALEILADQPSLLSRERV